jgi:SAM-dependent methyltransferase
VGRGLEIGGSAHNPFGLNTLNVDITDSLDTVFKQEELRLCGRAMPVDLVAPGDCIPLPDGSQDFVVSSHVLEHCPDPIGALLEWDRLVRPGGIIFMIVPHKERTFDRDLPHTPLEKVVRAFADKGARPAKPAGGHGHEWVWVTADMVAVVEWMIGTLKVGWEVLEVADMDDKVGNGFAMVIRKTTNRGLAVDRPGPGLRPAAR